MYVWLMSHIASYLDKVLNDDRPPLENSRSHHPAEYNNVAS